MKALKMTTYQKYRKVAKRYQKLARGLLIVTAISLLLLLEFILHANFLAAELERTQGELTEVQAKYMDLMEMSNELNNLHDFKFSKAMQGELQEAYTVQDKIDEIEERLNEGR